MISFEQFYTAHKLLEDEQALNVTTNIAGHAEPMSRMARRQLPQIKDHNAFLEDLKEQGIETSTERNPNNTYTPLQNELDPEKIKKMKTYTDMKPIIVSKDNYVIDGHHRWAAQDTVDALKIHMNHDELLKMLQTKPYIKKEGI